MSMPSPIPPPPIQSVICYTCLVQVADGQGEIHDGQPLLTEYADLRCVRNDCPHKTAAIEARKRQTPATLADLESLKTRVTALERRP